MNKAELVEQIAAEVDLHKTVAAKAVDALLNTLMKTLASGEEVVLVGFGTFTVKERAERTGRNPKTGEPITIAASKAPGFKAGKALKDAVNGK